MLWMFILKEWKGIVSGGVACIAMALVPISILYSSNKSLHGTIVRLEADLYAVEIQRDAAIATKKSAETALRVKNRSVDLWIKRYRTIEGRLSEYVRASNERNRIAREEMATHSSIATSAIRRASTTEDAIMAFADAILGEPDEGE